MCFKSCTPSFIPVFTGKRIHCADVDKQLKPLKFKKLLLKLVDFNRQLKIFIL